MPADHAEAVIGLGPRLGVDRALELLRRLGEAIGPLQHQREVVAGAGVRRGAIEDAPERANGLLDVLIRQRQAEREEAIRIVRSLGDETSRLP